MPAQTPWSSNSSPIVAAPAARARRITSSRSKGSTRISGPRCATRCSASATSSIFGAAKHTATTSSKPSTTVAVHAGSRQRSPGRYRCHDPVIPMCECSAIPPSNCIIRCFPVASTRSRRRPLSRAIACGRASVTVLPDTRRRRAAAVRQIVSPSGKDGPAFRPQHDTLRCRPEARFPQHRL